MALLCKLLIRTGELDVSCRAERSYVHTAALE